MEDDKDHGDGSGSTPESLLPYDQWMEDALRHVVARALSHAATEGLPGQHHYYVTFRTDFPNVVIPARLREKYPEEMTIVLQHQYDDLLVDEAARLFSVSLSFGGVLSPLTIPLDAVSAFVDPHVQYGLRFRVLVPEPVKAPTARLSLAAVDTAPNTGDAMFGSAVWEARPAVPVPMLKPAASQPSATATDGTQPAPAEPDEHQGDADPQAADDTARPQVVSLDAFRRRKE